MALTGSTQPKRPGAGVYPGAGVAAGGQQGRSNAITNGIGKQGGATARASQPKPPVGYQSTLNSFAQQAQARLPAASNGSRAGAPQRPLVKPGALKPLAPVTPGPPRPPLGTQDETGAYRDSRYFMDRAALQGQYDTSLADPFSELTRLRAVTNGQTLYDRMYADANDRFMRNVSGTRNDASLSGLLRSGAYDRQAADLASAYGNEQQDLYSTVGAGRIRDLEASVAQQQAALQQQLAALALSSEERMRQQRAAENAATYGQTILPSS